MKTLLTAAAIVLLATTSAHAHVKNVPQDCTGTVTFANNEYRLADTPSGDKWLWCDAIIGMTPAEPSFVDPKMLAKVLKVCPVGAFCHIKGRFSGHGEFVWTKITHVKREEECSQ